MERREEILLKATELFMRFGARSVTMDSIAQHVGISKKTLYTHFDDKKALMLKCIQHSFETQKAKCQALYAHKLSPLQVIYHLSVQGLQQLEHINPSLLLDLQKYYRKSWNEFLSFKNEFLGTELVNQVERGIKDGSVRQEVDAQLAVKLHLLQVENCMNPTNFAPQEYRARDVMEIAVESFLRSIATSKGLKEIAELFNSKKESRIN